ncbi:MAG: hypothetical protein ABL982_23930, partial [Vicinamibacterales bacterium]
MKQMLRAASASALAAGVGVMLSSGTSVQAQSPAAEQIKFHHVHLNSTDPAAAAAYYPKPFAKTATV